MIRSTVLIERYLYSSIGFEAFWLHGILIGDTGLGTLLRIEYRLQHFFWQFNCFHFAA